MGRSAAHLAERLGSKAPKGFANRTRRRKVNNGLLAQLVEHRVHIAGATGSSPVQTTKKLLLPAGKRSFFSPHSALCGFAAKQRRRLSLRLEVPRDQKLRSDRLPPLDSFTQPSVRVL